MILKLFDAIAKKLEVGYYKFLRPERQVLVKNGEYHRPSFYRSDAELMDKWRAVKHGFEGCTDCYIFERGHGELEDTTGEISLDDNHFF